MWYPEPLAWGLALPICQAPLSTLVVKALGHVLASCSDGCWPSVDIRLREAMHLKTPSWHRYSHFLLSTKSKNERPCFGTVRAHDPASVAVDFEGLQFSVSQRCSRSCCGILAFEYAFVFDEFFIYEGLFIFMFFLWRG